MTTEKPIVKDKFLLERYPGKGGWTYVVIPELVKDRKGPFRWLKVYGTIDSFEIDNYNLMPIKGGKLFLLVRAEIRKKINKQAGDWVKVVLYRDYNSFQIPADLLVCLEDEPLALRNFKSYKEADQRAFVNWINSAKKEDTKIARITIMIEKVSANKKLEDLE